MPNSALSVSYISSAQCGNFLISDIRSRISYLCETASKPNFLQAFCMRVLSSLRTELRTVVYFFICKNVFKTPYFCCRTYHPSISLLYHSFIRKCKLTKAEFNKSLTSLFPMNLCGPWSRSTFYFHKYSKSTWAPFNIKSSTII